MGAGPLIAPPRAAVFLDRDGVINENVYYADVGEWEAPRAASDYRFIAKAIDAMRDLQDAGFRLFVVSNQPNQAKRKATPQDHQLTHARLMSGLTDADVRLVEAYYCFHHPQGLEPALSGPCVCRKPAPYFLHQARDAHGVDLPSSWMVGDRDTDIQCGRIAGTRTIRIADNLAQGETAADHVAGSLWDASRIIVGSLR